MMQFFTLRNLDNFIIPVICGYARITRHLNEDTNQILDLGIISRLSCNRGLFVVVVFFWNFCVRSDGERVAACTLRFFRGFFKCAGSADTRCLCTGFFFLNFLIFPFCMRFDFS